MRKRYKRGLTPIVLFFTEAEVAGITQTWNDVGVAVQLRIHCGAPESYIVLREHLAHVINTSLSCYD